MKKWSIVGLVLGLISGLTLIPGTSTVYSADYPTKNIMAISPWPAGSASSNAFKGYMEFVEKHLGGKIVVDYKPGGMGGIAFIAVKGAPADGYTLGMLTVSIFAIELQKLAEVSYKDFDILNVFTFQPRALFVHSDSPWKTIDEFLGYVKQNPGKLRCGYEGIGQVDISILSNASGIKMIGIPFKGTDESFPALLGKHTEALSSSIPQAVPHMKAGTIRMLAVYGETRMEEFPDVPTFREKGYDVVRGGWRVVVAPKGTPDAIRKKLIDAHKKAFDDPGFQEFAKKANMGPFYLSPEKTEAFLDKDFLGEKQAFESIKK